MRGLAFSGLVQYLVPGIRDIAPKDEDTNHHKYAENNLKHISHPQHQANLRPPKCHQHIHDITDFAKPLCDIVNWVNSSQLLPPIPMECQP